jgi:hypothetical protein
MFHPVKWALAELTNEPYGTSIVLEGKDAKRFRHYAGMGVFTVRHEGDSLRVWNVDPNAPGAPERPTPEPQPEPAPTVDLAAENEALRQRIAELEERDRSVFAEAPLLPAPDALMSDWGEVGAYPGIPDDFVQLMTGDETLEQAVERMTLGVDELLDMATVLSDQSLELALCTVPPERVNEWTEKLITEKARLRRLRGTVDENFGRENLVSRVQGMFAQVGAKR